MRFMPTRPVGHRFGIVALALGLMIFPAMPPVHADEDVSYCSGSAPPSGQYLDPNLERFFHYDCQTGTLTSGDFSTDLCHVEVINGTETPVAGLCLLLSEGTYSDEYEITALIALVGSYPKREINTWAAHNQQIELHCSDDTFSCGGVVLSNSFVTYWYETGTEFRDGACMPHLTTGTIRAYGGTSGQRIEGSDPDFLAWCAI